MTLTWHIRAIDIGLPTPYFNDVDIPVACIMCALNVDNTSLILPVAQATVIVAPIFFREQIVRRVRGVVRRETSAADSDGDGLPVDSVRPRGTVRRGAHEGSNAEANHSSDESEPSGAR